LVFRIKLRTHAKSEGQQGVKKEFGPKRDEYTGEWEWRKL